VLAIVLDGLEAVLQQARTGEPNGMGAVRRIRRYLREIDALGGIDLPGGQQGS
jgi:hypothetical protein